ncbi:MAG: hypothetical protein ABFD15_09130 [Methanofastidiosum sp.]
MNKETLQKFLNLACQLSPENLCCDGELSREETNRRYRELMRQWKALEKEVGKKVTENEVFSEALKAKK